LFLENANSIILDPSNIEFWKNNNKNVTNKEEIEDTKKRDIKTEIKSRNKPKNKIINLKFEYKTSDKIINLKENNEKKNTKNNNILAINHDLDYYDYLKNNQKMYQSRNHNNNIPKLKGNVLNKNILSLENSEKILNNPLNYDIKAKRKKNISKGNLNNSNNYVDIENSPINKNIIYKTLFEREKEKQKNKSSKVINNNKKNTLTNFIYKSPVIRIINALNFIIICPNKVKIYNLWDFWDYT
jgi:hypothetical protein